MKNHPPISITGLIDDIKVIKQEIVDFAPEKYEALKSLIAGLENDMHAVLRVSENRQAERLQRRASTNKEIRKYNKQGPRDAIEKYISEHTKEYLALLEQKGIHIDNSGTLFVGKLKKRDRIEKVVPVDFVPKQIIEGDHYAKVKAELEQRKKMILLIINADLEAANEKAKNIYESYTSPSELFDKLGIKVQKVDYSFFEKEAATKSKARGIKKEGPQELTPAKEPCEAPQFKKIGSLMKYLKDNDIPFRANNIVQDTDQRYQFYFYKHDISILISDVVVNNCFRDATYVVKGTVPGLKYINREELRNFQGKKLVFSDTRPRRIESVFADDPENWPLLIEEKEPLETPKKLINDRTQLITIIKANFTPETFTGPAYTIFAKDYNAKPENELLLNHTISGIISLLGLGGKASMEDIKTAIFESRKPKLQIPEGSYLYTKNPHVKQTLLDISKCEGFDPDKVLGSRNYTSRVWELLRKAYKEEFVDAIKNKAPKEKKEKLEAYTGIKNFPLVGLKLTLMLGGRVRSVETDYQKMLRKKFMMHNNNQTTLEDYRKLQTLLLDYETKREDQGMHPNMHKFRETEGVTDPETVEKGIIELKKPKKDVLKKKQDHVPEKEIVDTTITMDTFPLYTIQTAKVVAEKAVYRVVKMDDCPIELRLYKTHNKKNIIVPGSNVQIFGMEKYPKEGYIKVQQEKMPGRHKVVEFRNTHEDDLIEKCPHGKKCHAVINNTDREYVYLSLSKNHCGRIVKKFNKEYQVGEKVKVIFDRIIEDNSGKQVVKVSEV